MRPFSIAAETGFSETLPWATALADHGNGWRALEDDADEPNVFASADMLAAAAGTVAPDDWQTVSVGADTGRLDAVASFRVARAVPVIGPPIVETFWSDYGPLGTPLMRHPDPEIAHRLLDAFADVGDVVRMRYQQLDGPVVAALTAAAETRGLLVEVTDAHERALLMSNLDREDALGPGLKAKRQKELARLFRRLQDMGPVEHEVATTPYDVAAALETYIHLEHKGWKGLGRSSFAADPTRCDFARTFVRRRAERGLVRIDTLTLSGTAIASLITHVCGDTGFLWKIAHDEDLAVHSPGVQIVRLATDAFLADPTLARVDSLATAEHPMIDRLWAGRLRMGTLVFATNPGANRKAARVVALHDGYQRLRAAARSVRSRIKR